MLERSPEALFTEISESVIDAPRKARKDNRIGREQENSRQLFEYATQVLKDYGKLHERRVGVEVEPGAIEYRSRPEQYHETPPVPFKFADGTADLILAEEFKDYPGFRLKDTIALIVEFGEDPENRERKQLFSVNKDGVSINWKGESATAGQIDVARGIFSSIEKSLAETNKKNEVEAPLKTS